jgi:branched-subunit amino acid transport protein AzlD
LPWRFWAHSFQRSLFFPRAPFLLFFFHAEIRRVCSAFIEKYIPPMIMAILVVYCLKDVQITERPWGAPSFIALAVCVGLHLWKHNPMISIFGSTVLYMILIRIM